MKKYEKMIEKGWKITSQTKTEVSMQKVRPKFSIWWLILFGIFYIIWWVVKPEVETITVSKELEA